MFGKMDDEMLVQFSSYGMIGNEKIVCQYLGGHKINPLHHATSLLITQIILMFAVGRITHLLLRPCNQTLLIAQIMVSFFVLSQLAATICWLNNLSCNYISNMN